MEAKEGVESHLPQILLVENLFWVEKKVKKMRESFNDLMISLQLT